MSLISKQASSENGSFYVLQSPNSRVASYHIGEVFLEEDSSRSRVGFFTTYDKSREQSLASPGALLNADQLSSYLNREASSAELRLNSSFDGKNAYSKTFEEIQAVLSGGGLKKAVLFSSVAMMAVDFPSKADFFAHCLRLLKNQKGGYLFGFYNPERKLAYLGITPEFLCRESEGCKYTTAVAGTKIKGESEGEIEGKWSQKLIKEQDLVKKGIASHYKVEWSKTAVQKYGDLRHLKSEGLLKTKDSVAQISSALHPTSAVGTLPHKNSYSYKLGDRSQKERGFFGGYVYLSADADPFSLVTIRGIEWSNNESFVCIGGGVIAESLLDDEWLELERKWKTFEDLWKS